MQSPQLKQKTIMSFSIGTISRTVMYKMIHTTNMVMIWSRYLSHVVCTFIWQTKDGSCLSCSNLLVFYLFLHKKWKTFLFSFRSSLYMQKYLFFLMSLFHYAVTQHAKKKCIYKKTKIGPGQSGPHTDCICSMVLKGCPEFWIHVPLCSKLHTSGHAAWYSRIML